ITFETNAGGTAPGFKAEFSTTSPQWCLGLVELTDVSGTFDDGSGTFFYNNNATCMWRIQPEYANVITIYFNYFDTELDHDILKVYDGSTVIATFSGSDLPDPVEVTSGSAFITWSSNSSITAPGWEILYEIDNIGVEEKEAFADLQIYPNPAQDMLNISFSSNNLQSFEIKLMNITGKLVYAQNYTDHSGNFNKNINLSNLAKGVYILNLNSATGTLTKKVVIR
ncbi:MAG: T9SS type A sorting domain-containing protein, partial [Bacteroidetes bacterium]|nr:T9SS type A sorting domain-containing protein [Bacteroidota bacterium]